MIGDEQGQAQHVLDLLHDHETGGVDARQRSVGGW